MVPKTETRKREDVETRFPPRLILAFVLVFIVIIAGGMWFYQDHGRQSRQSIENQLQSIAQLKVDQIVRWRNDLISDATRIMDEPFYVEGFADWVQSPDAESASKIVASLQSIQKHGLYYSDVFLVDTNGKVLTGFPKTRERRADEVVQQLARAFQERKAVLTDFHYPPGDPIPHLDVIAPLFSMREGTPVAIGAVILCVDADRFLYPFIQSWPVPSNTAETLLVRRDGDQVLFLNELRHQKDTALKLREPLSQVDLPAAMAVLGKEGIIEGKDYRGVAVLAALRHIPDSPWYIVAKVDTVEAFSAIRFGTTVILSLTVGLLLIVFAVVWLFWQRRQKDVYQALYQAEVERRALLSHFEYLIKYANDIILLVDENQRIIEVNDRALESYGYSREEMLRLSMADIIATEDLPQYQLRRHEVLEKGAYIREGIHKRKDGSQFPVEISARLINVDGEQYYQEIIRDITERRRMEEHLRSANRLYALLSAINQAIVRTKGRQELFESICQIAVETGEFRLAWIGLIDQGDGGIKPVTHCGYEEGYLRVITEIREEHPSSKGPTSMALSEGIVVTCNDIATDPGMLPWRDEALKRGYRSAASVPLKLKGKVIGNFNIYADRPEFFSGEERRLLEEIGADISYALDAIETERQRQEAEESLQRAELHYRTLFEDAPLMYVIARSEEGRPVIVDCNKTFAKTLGYTRDEIRGRPMADFLTPASVAAMQNAYPLLLKGQVILADRDLVTKDGSIIHTSMRAALEVNSSGETIGTYAMFADITERKRAEEALRALSSRQEAILAAVPDIIMEVDNNKVYTWANKAGFEFFGEDVIGKEAAYYFEGEQDTYNKVEPLFKGDESVVYVESWQRRRDGQKRLLGWWCRVLKDEHGNVRGALSSASDITEFKQAEEAVRRAEENFRSSLDGSPFGVRIVTTDGETVYANRAILDIYGFDSIDELRATPRKKYYTPESYAEHQLRKEKRRRGEYVPPEYEISIVRKDGEVRHLRVFRKEVRWNGRRHFQVIYQDITERKHLEEEQQRVAKLEAVGMLAGGIAHDFNNLLTGILGNISLARMKTRGGNELHDMLAEVEKASLRAKGLTQQLLTFAKGGVPVKKTASIASLLRDTTTFVLRGSGIKCELSIPEDLWQVEVDEGQIAQVISNIVINAQQAMPNGGVIEVRAENFVLAEEQSLGKSLPLEKGNYVRIAIADNGMGIPPEHVDRIFDPYFTTKQKGSGLGLATSYSIIRNHGGYISVESKVGRGSTFYIYLPASMEKAAAEKVKKVKLPAGRGRILLMDDEEIVRDVASRMLKHIGYEDVELASDGAEAVALYKAALESGRPFAAVILDLTVPGGMGGKDTLKKLREVDAGVKAIVSSGYSSESVSSEYQNYGFCGVVAKPYTIDQLRQVLHEVIGDVEAPEK